jgi:amino acid transporter/nucleotide-binding universal stress UspA family protein
MSATQPLGARVPPTELSRDLGLFDITMVGVAAMIGAGIFVLTGIAAGTAGPALMVAFALNGVVTLLTAMVYAELGSAIPEAGGGYLWVRQGLPGGNAFMAGWMSWFAHAVAGSLYALGFGAHLGEVFKHLGMPTLGLQPAVFAKLAAVVIALVFIYINFKGASETGTAGNIVTLGKIAIIGLFILSGLWAILRQPARLANFRPFAPRGLSGILSAMGLTVIAYEGYEVIVQTGEEVRDPRRSVPRAVFLALLIVVPIYMMVAFVCIGAVTPESPTVATWQWLGEQAELGLARAAGQFMPLGSFLLLVGALFSTMSALNATTYSSTRVSFAMGRDRNLPDIFGKVHRRTRTPYLALALSGALIIVVAVAIPIEPVAASADIMFLLLFMQVNIAVITIRRKYGDKLAYGYIVPFFPYLPFVAILTQLLLIVIMLRAYPLAACVTIGWLAAGALIHWLYASRRELEEEVTPVLVEERMRVDRERFSVLVPVANPENVDTLLAVARSILQTKPGNLLLVHVITVPDQLPVSVGRDFVEDARPIVELTAERAEEMGMTPNLLVRVGHRPADAIIDTVRETNANFVVMGWRGRSRDPRTVVGRNIDRIVKLAHANVAVVRGDVRLPARRILVPIEHPRHGHLMAEFAAPLTTEQGGYIELLHVVDRQRSAQQRAERAAELRRDISELDTTPDEQEPGRRQQRFRIRIAGGGVVSEIAERSRDFDLVVMGASQESWIRRKVWGDKTFRVANRIECPLMLVNLRVGRLQFSVSQFFQFFWDVEETQPES